LVCGACGGLDFFTIQIFSYMKKIISSPRTTWAALAGIFALLFTQIGYIFDNNPATVVDFETVIPQFLALAGVLFARDNNKSSEDVGIKPPTAPVNEKL
jgi:hypothetical protein